MYLSRSIYLKYGTHPAYIPHRFASKLRTITGFDYTLTQKQAEEIIDSNKSMYEQSPSEEIRIAHYVNPMKKVYFPFHTIDVKNLLVTYVGKMGIDKTRIVWKWQTVGKHMCYLPAEETYIKWTGIRGKSFSPGYPIGTPETQIYAGFNYPRPQIEKVLRFPYLNQLEKIKVDDETEIDKHDMKMSFALEKMISSLHRLEQNRLEQELLSEYNAHHIELSHIDLKLEQSTINLSSYHIPAYVYTHNTDGLDLHKIVNAIDGNYDGEVIYSPLKVGLTGTAIGFLIAAASMFLRTNPYFTVAQILFRLGIASSTGGMFGAIWAKYLAPIALRSIRNEIKDDISYNDQMPETYDDVRRRGNNQENKQTRQNNYSHNKTNEIYYPEDECHLLGLSHHNRITLEELRDARNSKLRQWHPDVYKGNKTLANEMCQRVNDAYHKLEIIVKNQ